MVGSGGGLTSDLQAGLTLPCTVLVHRLAGVESGISPLSCQDAKPAKATLCFLCKTSLVWAHGLAVSQPARGARAGSRPVSHLLLEEFPDLKVTPPHNDAKDPMLQKIRSPQVSTIPPKAMLLIGFLGKVIPSGQWTGVLLGWCLGNLVAPGVKPRQPTCKAHSPGH